MNSFIKSLMDERNLKQKDLALILGISPAAISSWKDDVNDISTEHLYSLSKIFHVTVDELLEEKRTGESLEDKWKREYDINENMARMAMEFQDKEDLLQCLEIVAKANDRFFVLLEKKIKGRISDTEIKELEYLNQFYETKADRNYLFTDVQIYNKDVGNITLLDIVKAKLGEENHEAILWEMKNIFKITDFDIDQSILDDFDDEVFYAWYNILTPVEKDEIINVEYNRNRGKSQRVEYLYELIKRGGKLLYIPKDLNLINYDYKDLEKFKDKEHLSELDKARAVVYEIYDNYSLATYEQYQALINLPRMRQIEMEAKYKEKNPIKYWEYIKSNEVLI